MLEKVRRHFRLRERVADSDCWDVLEKDDPELVHRLRVDLECLLQELDAEQVSNPTFLAEQPRLWCRIFPNPDADDPQVRLLDFEGANSISNGVERWIVRAVSTVV